LLSDDVLEAEDTHHWENAEQLERRALLRQKECYKYNNETSQVLWKETRRFAFPTCTLHQPVVYLVDKNVDLQIRSREWTES
jgi:hypothetical protein